MDASLRYPSLSHEPTRETPALPQPNIEEKSAFTPEVLAQIEASAAHYRLEIAAAEARRPWCHYTFWNPVVSLRTSVFAQSEEAARAILEKQICAAPKAAWKLLPSTP